MSRNLSVIDYFGFACPDGGDFYSAKALGRSSSAAASPTLALVMWENVPKRISARRLSIVTITRESLHEIATLHHQTTLQNFCTRACKLSHPLLGVAKRMRVQTRADVRDAIFPQGYLPAELHARGLSWVLEWLWDILLTVAPLMFIVLSVLVLRLDGQLHSDHGEMVFDLARLGPTIYPILFATISSRFYKNLARWRLEQPKGIGLGALEQISGSQTFAGAFERLLFVRTHVLIGAAILVAWAMSPLGGQGTSRMLIFGKSTTSRTGTVYYLHPSYQFSYTTQQYTTDMATTNWDVLYAGSLLSSQSQKQSARDLWDLPRMPPKTPHTTNRAFYIQGLDFATGETQYNFDVETPYVDFTCRLIGSNSSEAPQSIRTLTSGSGDEDSFTTFGANVTGPNPWGAWGDPDITPSLHLIYASMRKSFAPNISYVQYPSYYVVFNCTMEVIVVQTEMQCGPRPSSTSCSAKRQRRVSDQRAAHNYFSNIFKNRPILNNFLNSWQRSSGIVPEAMITPADSYISGNAHPYAASELTTPWGDGLDGPAFSKRLTTSFNTFWQGTLDPFGHTNVSFKSDISSNQQSMKSPSDEPFMNSTQARATMSHNVYKANRYWITIVLILAVIGLGLRLVIRGPDVLGFASSMTRENPYVALPPGGSGLDGPERAKILREVRVRLAGVRPTEEVGYAALKAVSAEGETKSSEGPFIRKRLYL
ncbi:hypothetical protein B0T10DRAFT_538933 [Thelonectria olida]|uniref:Uncharacterized protein n=1 Tax=Thelonectria olida TaxID=1576542 RepID=A0A9P9ANR8_9HYPO|nr:hypothetical protein B0T10DRAFT_538933 [Thelonectria olida]